METSVDFDNLKEKANQALDELDSKLEKIEHQAGKWVSLFTSFFSTMVSVDETPDSQHESKDEAEIGQAFPGASYGTSRYEMELFKFHTDESLYHPRNGDVNESARDDVHARTDEISSLLEEYPETLLRLMKKLVPLKLTYDDFWSQYFAYEEDLKKSERQRKSLLSKDAPSLVGTDKEGPSPHIELDTEEDFVWDEEEDEEVNNDSAEVR